MKQSFLIINIVVVVIALVVIVYFFQFTQRVYFEPPQFDCVSLANQCDNEMEDCLSLINNCESSMNSCHLAKKACEEKTTECMNEHDPRRRKNCMEELAVICGGADTNCDTAEQICDVAFNVCHEADRDCEIYRYICLGVRNKPLMPKL